MSLTLRVKAKNGQHVIKNLTGSSSLGDLQEAISGVTGIPALALKVKMGYPPTAVDMSSPDASLSSLSVRSGETLIVEEDSTYRQQKEQQNTQDLLQAMQEQLDRGGGILTRHVVPANNSCLFTSINFVMEGGKMDLSAAPAMRQVIAGVVMSDPQTYNEGFLGRSNSEYCQFIMNDDTWGGAIEVSILSKYYNVEIGVVDTQTVRIDRFGEDQNYARRVLLLYDGIHYDPLMLEPFDPADQPKTIFSTDDAQILSQALELATEAKSSRQYTDTANFTLRCLICQTPLTGETQAQQHAKDTGHINFGEV